MVLNFYFDTHNVVITVNIMGTCMPLSGNCHVWKSFHWSHHVVDLDFVASITISTCHHQCIHQLYATGITEINKMQIMKLILMNMIKKCLATCELTMHQMKV